MSEEQGEKLAKAPSALRLLRSLSPRNLLKFFRYLRLYGFKETLRRTLNKLFPERGAHKLDDRNILPMNDFQPAAGVYARMKLRAPLCGTFWCPQDDLCRVAVRMAASVYTTGLSLTLAEQDGSVIRRSRVTGRSVWSGGYADFYFDPIEDSGGKGYLFTLSANGIGPMAVWHDSAADVNGMALNVGGSIACRLYRFSRGKGDYTLWRARNEPDDKTLRRQKEIRLADAPLISILVPLYNTPTPFLCSLLKSVEAQTYVHWELCLSDGGNPIPENQQLLREAMQRCPNIKYRALPENLGIAGNTNAAADLATGQWIALLDHDDTLAPFALYEMARAMRQNPGADLFYSDEDKLSENGARRFDPYFKPDFSPDTLRSYNYIAHLTVLRRELFERIGRFRAGYDGSQDYDLVLRASEQARQVVHIPKVLYHWRMSADSTAQNPEAKMYAYESAKRALTDHLERVGLGGEVSDGLFYGSYRIRYAPSGEPLVSVIIPNKDNGRDLRRCVESVLESTYRNIEILIVENNSASSDTFALYEALKRDSRVTVVRWEPPFNFSAINNFAVTHAKGAHLLFLNNDTKALNPDWLEQMLCFSQRPDVGAVGAKLFYPDDTIQHGGVILGIGGIAGHAHKYFSGSSDGYFGRLKIVQNVSAVTAACLMMRKDVFEEIGGFDESLAIAFNDVDLCLRIRRAGYLIVWTPYAQLTHYESKTRGYEDTQAKVQRFNAEIEKMAAKWGQPLMDPYYSPNLTQKHEDYSLNVE